MHRKIFAAAIFAAVFLAGCGDTLGTKYVGFAQCLTQEGATMYGAYWCPHCANQKKLFGAEGFRSVHYVECDPRGDKANPELCQQKNIKGYPTWIFADDSRLEGEISLEKLAEKTKCELPPASEGVS